MTKFFYCVEISLYQIGIFPFNLIGVHWTGYNTTGCVESCRFIESRKRVKPGTCKPSNNNSQLDQSSFRCSYTCDSDSDCVKIGTKCCYTQMCGRTCQAAQLPYQNVPPIPSSIKVKQSAIATDSNLKPEFNLDIDWSTYDFTQVKDPVVFVVEMRRGPANQQQNFVHGRWRHIITTCKTGLIISELNLRSWYQFRVLAINQYGYRGVSVPTNPLTLNVSIVKHKQQQSNQLTGFAPPAPINVNEIKSTIVNNAAVHSTIEWSIDQAQLNTNLLPITQFKLTWRKYYIDNEHNNPLIKEYHIIIPGNQMHYTIENLLPSTTYLVTIKSVIKYMLKEYNSSSVIYYLTTPKLPAINQQIINELPSNNNYQQHRQTLTNNNCFCDESNDLLPVAIGPFRLATKDLTARIKLKDSLEILNSYSPYTFFVKYVPRVCIDADIDSSVPVEEKTIISKNTIDGTLTGLKFRCNYQLKIELFSDMLNKNVNAWKGCFCTPGCIGGHYDKSGRLVNNDCSNNSRQSQINRVPLAPFNIKVTTLLSSSSSLSTSSEHIGNQQLSAEVSWHSPSLSSEVPIKKYLVVWGPRIDEPLDESMYDKSSSTNNNNSFQLLPLLNYNKALSKVVIHPQQFIVLNNLQPNKIYIVKIQSISKANQLSSETIAYFKINLDNSLPNSAIKYDNLQHIRLVMLAVALGVALIHH